MNEILNEMETILKSNIENANTNTVKEFKKSISTMSSNKWFSIYQYKLPYFLSVRI